LYITEALSQHKPPELPPLLRFTLDEITTNCDLLDELKERLIEWNRDVDMQKTRLFKFSLCDYFWYISDCDAFNKRDSDIRSQIISGEVYMVKLNGDMVDDLNEAKSILVEYPRYDVHNIVETVKYPQYFAFDDKYDKVELRNNRCLINVYTLPGSNPNCVERCRAPNTQLVVEHAVRKRPDCLVADPIMIKRQKF
jgi:hypothetical protein